MTREQLFAAPKLAGRAMARLERGIAAVSAARARAAEIAQQTPAQTGACPFAGTPSRRTVKRVGHLEPLGSEAASKSRSTKSHRWTPLSHLAA